MKLSISRISRLVVLPALWTLLIVFGSAASAQTAIRLIDDTYHAPIEFWVKNLEVSHGGVVVRYAMPRQFYVDGKVVEFVRYEGAAEAGSGGGGGGGGATPAKGGKADEAGAASGEVDNYLIEMGAKEGKEAEINSDQKLDVTTGNGPKALIRAKLAAGEHVIHPGGLKFTLDAAGDVVKADDGLKSVSRGGMTLACHPIDVNLLPFGGAAGKKPVEVKIESGGHVVFGDTYPLGGPEALRIYLPLSDEGYDFTLSDRGTFHVKAGKDGLTIVGEPKLAAGVTLDVSGFVITPYTVAASSAKAEAPVPGAKPEVYLFTDRNRESYLEGERIAVSVRAFGGAAEDVTLSLNDGKAALALPSVKPTRSGVAEVTEFEIDTRPLRPGKYTLSAACGGAKSNSLPITIVSAMPATNMQLFASTKWGPGDMSPQFVRAAADSGLNMISMGISAGHGASPHGPNGSPFDAWGYPTKYDDKKLAEFRGPHFPVELAEIATPHNAGMDALLAGGVHFVPNIFGSGTGMILYFNAGPDWLDQAEDRLQTTQGVAQEFRRFPNFIGAVYCTGDGPTPATIGSVFGTVGVANFDVWHGKRLDKLREQFEAKFGKIEVNAAAGERVQVLTDADKKAQAEHGFAWGYKVGEPIPADVKGDEAQKIAWSQWINDIYPDAFRRHRAAMGQILPDPIFNCGATWGPGAGGGMYQGTFYRDLSNPLNDMHGDYGVCNFNWVTGSDIVNMGLTAKNQRTWEGLDVVPNREPASGIKLMLEALSRNPAGVGVLALGQGTPVCDWAVLKDRCEDLRLMTELGRRFGDIYLNLQRVDEVAVVSSFRQEVLAGQPFRAMWAAHYVSQKAGYQTNVISDAFLESNPDEVAKRFKAVLLFRMTAPLSPAFKAGLEKFQKAGGVVIADQSSKIEVSNVVALPFEMPDSHGPSNQNDHLEFERFFAPFIEKFRGAVGPALKPFFTTSSVHVSAIRSRDGNVEYFTVFNDQKPEMDNGCEAQFRYRGLKATIGFALPGQAALYDALNQVSVPTHDDAGQRKFEADYSLVPGDIYVLTPRPAKSLAVSHSKNATPGSLVTFTVQINGDDDKPFTGRLPIELAITDASGTERYRVNRTTNTEMTFKIAGNDAPGVWHWSVKDQATGLTAEGLFNVQAGGGAPPVAAAQPVFNAPAVHSFLKHRQVEIILFPEEYALLDAAKELQKQLAAAGVGVTLRQAGPADLRPYPMQWEYLTIEDREARDGVMSGRFVGRRVEGKNQEQTYHHDRIKSMTAFYSNYAGSAELAYYKDVILLGRGDLTMGPLMELVTRNRMLPRNVSPNFPGAGDGLVSLAWSPFHFGNDAVVVYGRDDAGLKKAVASLVALAQSKEPPAAPYEPRQVREGQENGQIYATMGLAPADAAATVTSDKRQPRSFWPPVFAPKRTEQVLAVTAIKTDHGTLAAADGGVGLFDPSGKALWFYEPFPLLGTFHEIKMTRVCQNMVLSADGKWLLSAFYDLTPANEGPWNPEVVNRPDLILLDTATGKPAFTVQNVLGRQLFISSDGSRSVALDAFDADMRTSKNPHGSTSISVFDHNGKELLSVPLVGPIDRMMVNPGATSAAVSYKDARRMVSFIDLKSGAVVEHANPRSDVGIDVSPDGAMAVIGYSDGTLHAIDHQGSVVWQALLAAPGEPRFSKDGQTVTVDARDGNAYTLDIKGQLRGQAKLADKPAPPPIPKYSAVQPPAFWEKLPADVKATPLPGAPFAKGDAFAGDRVVTVNVPAMSRWDVAILAFDYKLDDANDELSAKFSAEGSDAVMRFPASAVVRRASVPLRPGKPGPVQITLSSHNGVTITNGKLIHLDLSSWLNGALTAKPGTHVEGGRENGVKIMVPAVYGLLGDMRAEQMAYGISGDAAGKTGLPQTDPFSFVDGKIYRGTPLYPAERRYDVVHSAQVLIEFEKAREVRGIGVWEEPNDRPASAWTLECTDAYKVEPMTKYPQGDWKLVAAGRGNSEYFHLTGFAPTKARIWRYTVIDTPGDVQRCAEIELYEEAVESLITNGTDEKPGDIGDDLKNELPRVVRNRKR